MPPSIDPFTAHWLAGNNTKAIDALKQAATVLDLPRGGIVYAYGAPQKNIYGVVKGQVRVFVTTNEMHAALGHIHAPGAWFGEVESVLAMDSYVQMEADTDTQLLRIGINQYRRTATEHPKLWESVTRLTAFNLWYATCAANDLVLRTPQQRIAASVLRLSGHRAATQGNPPIDSIRASQQEIADLSNVARTTCSKILHEYQDKAMIRLDYGRIAVLDPAKLAATLEL